MSPTTLQLPPRPPCPFKHWARDELIARIVGLEVENLSLLRRVEFQAEELRCAAARERHTRRLEHSNAGES
jgi:hypothetical protein